MFSVVTGLPGGSPFSFLYHPFLLTSFPGGVIMLGFLRWRGVLDLHLARTNMNRSWNKITLWALAFCLTLATVVAPVLAKAQASSSTTGSDTSSTDTATKKAKKKKKAAAAADK